MRLAVIAALATACARGHHPQTPDDSGVHDDTATVDDTGVTHLSDGHTITGEDDELSFGVSVLWSPDVTGDGKVDLLIGAADDTWASWAFGQLSVVEAPVFGASTIEAVGHATITSDEDGDESGYETGSPGDVDGDGLFDVAFASVESRVDGGSNTGRVFMFGAPVVGDLRVSDAEATYHETEPIASFGSAVAAIPESDGAMPRWAAAAGDGGASPGRVYVLEGVGEGVLSVQDVAVATIYGEEVLDGIGDSLDGLDHNGDGFTDLVAGANNSNATGTWAGSAYVALGPFAGERAFADDVVWRGENAQDRAGQAAAAVGDLDGDGYDEFAVGAFWYSAVEWEAGRAYVIRGGADPGGKPRGLEDAAVRIDGALAGDELGIDLCRAGDVDGDGSLDLAVQGAARSNDSLPKVYVFLGPLADGVLSASDANRVIEARDHASMAGGVDQDADGYADLALGLGSQDSVFVIPGHP